MSILNQHAASKIGLGRMYSHCVSDHAELRTVRTLGARLRTPCLTRIAFFGLLPYPRLKGSVNRNFSRMASGNGKLLSIAQF
jgi:hypothetical protein